MNGAPKTGLIIGLLVLAIGLLIVGTFILGRFDIVSNKPSPITSVKTQRPIIPEVNEKIISFSGESLLQPIENNKLKIERKDTRAENTQGVDPSTYNQYLGSATIVGNQSATVGYFESSKGVFHSEFIQIEEKGKKDDTLATVISVFDRYFKMPKVANDEWNRVNQAEGVISYEYVYPENPDGSFNTRSAYVQYNPGGFPNVLVLACKIGPDDPHYSDRSCIKKAGE